MKKTFILICLFLNSFSFAQNSWEEKKHIDQLKRDYIKAVSDYMKVYGDLSYLKDKWADKMRGKVISDPDPRREKKLRETAEIENELLWSPFEDSKDESTDKWILYKQHFKPDLRKIQKVLDMNAEQEKRSRVYKLEMDEVDKNFYPLVLKGYDATRNFLLILKEMHW